MAVTEAVSSGKSGQEQGGVYQWPAWHATLADYRTPSYLRAAWQLVTTLVPYGCLWLLLIRSIHRGYPYVLTLGLMIVAAAFLVRTFILFHDCVHGSLFPRKELNAFFGYVLGVLVFTPFEDWRFSHLRHHATYANLDVRGYGDIWTMTRTEYASSSWSKRVFYRLYRTPLVLLGLGAFFSFLLRFRLPARRVTRKERVSVLFTNLLIIGVVMIAARTMGWRTYLAVQLPVLWMAGVAGIWLFYVQHQFKGVYWARKGDWDALRAAMEGSSFYKLSPVLQWFSGSIGYHHVHHLGSRIPNYRLQECYRAIPALQAKPPLTLWQSLSSIRLKVWDEERQRLVGFD